MNMNTPYIIVAVVLVVFIAGVILGPVFARRQHSKRLQGQFGTEYDHTVEILGDKKKAHAEFDERQKHVASLDIQPLSAKQHDRYTTDWIEVPSKFVDEPGQGS